MLGESRKEGRLGLEVVVPDLYICYDSSVWQHPHMPSLHGDGTRRNEDRRSEGKQRESKIPHTNQGGGERE